MLITAFSASRGKRGNRPSGFQICDCGTYRDRSDLSVRLGRTKAGSPSQRGRMRLRRQQKTDACDYSEIVGRVRSKHILLRRLVFGML